MTTPDFVLGRDGTRIAYSVHPGPKPVLLVHGFGTTGSYNWERTGWVQALADAGRGSITVDLRGHGRSGKPHDADSYATQMMGADLLAVLDAAGVRRADVVAYSMGARVASALTQLAPERVSAIVIGGAGPMELFASWNLDEVRGYLRDNTPPRDDTISTVLRAILSGGGADSEALLACIEGVSGSALGVPATVPALFVVGELDPIASGAEGLALDWGSDVVTLPGRTHLSAPSSRAFQDAAIGFFANALHR